MRFNYHIKAICCRNNKNSDSVISIKPTVQNSEAASRQNKEQQAQSRKSKLIRIQRQETKTGNHENTGGKKLHCEVNKRVSAIQTKSTLKTQLAWCFAWGKK